jgi:hypothetical protein
LPVDAEHYDDHADERESVDEDAEEPGDDKRLDRIDVDGYTADKVAGRLLIVIREREPLDVRVNQAAQIVCHPLAYVRGEKLLCVSADGVRDRNCEYGDAREDENVARCGSGCGYDEVVQPSVLVLALK